MLVVDDNADMRDYIASLLASQYRVQTAPDGAVALELARANPPELVVTDVMMPNLDGFGLLAGLQADPATTDIPVIMVSARAGEDGTIEGLEAGADDYLVKPFAARELLARVHANIELDRARRTRDALRRSGDLLDQAQRLARIGSWEIDLETDEMTASDGVPAPGRADRRGAARGRARARDARAFTRTTSRGRRRRSTAGEETGRFELEFRLDTPDARDAHPPRARRAGARRGRPSRAGCAGRLQDVTEQRAAQAALATAAAEREAAERERAIANELQRSLLPERSFDADRLDVAAYYRAGVAGTQVGGDWYDVIDLGAGRTALVLGDVVGRGVRAAAVMGQLRAAVRAYAQLELSPAHVLESLDQVVDQFGDEQIVTCVYAVFDPREGSLVYSNAGQLPPLLVDVHGDTRRLEGAAGPPLGAGAATFAEERTELVPGTLLALYTDGLVEQRTRVIDDGIDALADVLSTADPPGRPGRAGGAARPGRQRRRRRAADRPRPRRPRPGHRHPGRRARHPLPARGPRVRQRHPERAGSSRRRCRPTRCCCAASSSPTRSSTAARRSSCACAAAAATC